MCRRQKQVAIIVALAALALIMSPAASADHQGLKEAALPVSGQAEDYSPLLAGVGDARFVLLGEATHGTQEFYVERARISRRLIEESGFRGVVIEADWSEVEPLNRYVRGLDDDAARAFAGFETFPRWMWRNTAFRDFVEWLRAWNMARPPDVRAGLYGMDVDQLFSSIDGTIRALDVLDPHAARSLRAHFRCFAPYRGSTAAYGRAARNPGRTCEAEALAARDALSALLPAGDPAGREMQFSALRHASTVVASEAYHRAVQSGSYEWNVRDTGMADAVQEIADHVSGSADKGRVIVWAHNTHVGNAGATSVSDQGETNLGRILRDRSAQVFSIGFLTSSGRVMAAENWGRPGRVWTILPPQPQSDAAILRDHGLDRALLIFQGRTPPAALLERRAQRAIGVVYVPGEERTAHYIEAVLADQFDAVIYIDTTTAVSPF